MCSGSLQPVRWCSMKATTAMPKDLPPHLDERTRVIVPSAEADGVLAEPRDAAFVLYWMHHAVRADENPALDVARHLAASHGCRCWSTKGWVGRTRSTTTATICSFCRGPGTSSGRSRPWVSGMFFICPPARQTPTQAPALKAKKSRSAASLRVTAANIVRHRRVVRPWRPWPNVPPWWSVRISPRALPGLDPTSGRRFGASGHSGARGGCPLCCSHAGFDQGVQPSFSSSKKRQNRCWQLAWGHHGPRWRPVRRRRKLSQKQRTLQQRCPSLRV